MTDYWQVTGRMPAWVVDGHTYSSASDHRTLIHYASSKNQAEAMAGKAIAEGWLDVEIEEPE